MNHSTGPLLPTMQNILSASPRLSESVPHGAGPILIWTIDREGLFQMVEGDLPINKPLKPGKLIGKSIFTVLADYPGILEAVQNALDGEQGSTVIQSGSQLWEWRFYPIQRKREILQGVIGLAFDLSFQQELWHQGAITDAATALRKAQTQEDMPPVIVDQLRKQLKIEQAVLVLGSHPDRPYELKFSWPEVKKGSVHPLLGILTDPDLIDNLDGGAWLDGFEPPRELQAAGMFGWPLIANDQMLGVLWVGRREPFNGAESRLVTGIANMAASAVQRAGQHELTRQRLARLAALHSIDQAISGSFNLNLTLHIILDQVVSQLDVDAADIFLVDPLTLETTYAEGKGFQRYQPQPGISQAREDLVWRVLQSRELVAIPDLYKEAPTLLRGRMFAMEGFRSYYGIPLIAKGKILGVMEVFHRKPLQVDEEWFDFLRTLGIQAAIAMDNAALVENLRRSNLMLDLAYNTTLEGWVRALDLRDKITGEHTQRVVERTLKLAQAVGIPDGQLVHVRRGA
ncbi:MAG: GAF domain-containing protein, partial [Anaerolineales bacterium]|nr:GAF domain-containing protein [Anaerolineales bacterium]